ncbi:MAG: 30S ribosomal protein S2 [Holosporales bacterium]|jgi:small subunit ribosomal protein S2|nr:30S ribosomal protein S2 [Holosporales bacterium]
MSINFTMRQLLDAGVHYGHITRKWNPKMAGYIFGKRNGVHIMDLEQTVPMLENALRIVSEVISNYGRVLFVGTKAQASEKIKEAAQKCGQYYVNHRWLGGMLTNWKTVSQSIKRLKSLEEKIADPVGFTKKEILQLQREKDKLDLVLNGIREMGGVPDLVIVIDTIKESIVVKEAAKLKIPIIAIVDTNSDPDDITYPIPGNDDATKAIELYCDLFSRAVLEGLQKGMEKSGVDIGSASEIVEEGNIPEVTTLG